MKARATRADKKPVRKGTPPSRAPLRKPLPVWLVTTAAFLLPGSGQMLNGNPVRGIIMQFFMLVLGFVTYQVTTPDISIIGRFSGGIFIYVMSVIDANTAAKRRMQAWTRATEAASQKKNAPKKQPRRPATASAGAQKKAGKRRPAPSCDREPARQDALEGPAQPSANAREAESPLAQPETQAAPRPADSPVAEQQPPDKAADEEHGPAARDAV